MTVYKGRKVYLFLIHTLH